MFFLLLVFAIVWLIKNFQPHFKWDARDNTQIAHIMREKSRTPAFCIADGREIFPS
jgi:hypothetical protein